MRRALGLALAALLAAGAPPPAQARPADPIVMTAAGGQQAGTTRYFTEHRLHGRTCSSMHADGIGPQPEAVAHDGSPLYWRLSDKRRPIRVTVRVYRLAVDRTPVATPAEYLRATLTPVTSRGRVVGWDVTTPEVGYGDLDVAVTVRWRGACGGEDETSQRFHARSLPVPPL